MKNTSKKAPSVHFCRFLSGGVFIISLLILGSCMMPDLKPELYFGSSRILRANLEIIEPPFTGNPVLAEQLAGGAMGAVTTLRVGQILTVDMANSSLAASDTYYYSWYRDETKEDNVIPGANSQSYALTTGDVGHSLYAGVSAKGYESKVFSTAVGPVSP